MSAYFVLGVYYFAAISQKKRRYALKPANQLTGCMSYRLIPRHFKHWLKLNTQFTQTAS